MNREDTLAYLIEEEHKTMCEIKDLESRSVTAAHISLTHRKNYLYLIRNNILYLSKEEQREKD